MSSPPTPVRVALVACSSYDQEEVRGAVDRCFDLLGGAPTLVRPGDRVLVKPNLLMSLSPKRAVTTHPEVVAAVIRAAQSAGGVVEVGDSPMFTKTESTLRRCGILGRPTAVLSFKGVGRWGQV